MQGKEPSDTVMADNNVYVACQVTDDLDYGLKNYGTDNIVICTDYGHSGLFTASPSAISGHS